MRRLDFERDGFVVIRHLVDPVPMIEALMAYFVTEAEQLEGRAINRVAGTINSVHGIDAPFFTALLHDPALISVASECLGEPAVPRAVECFAKPAKLGLPSPWHQDNAYWCADPAVGLTIWMALDPCSADNGGLTYIRGSHRGGLLPHYASFAPGSSQTIGVIPQGESVTPMLDPGDALVHHCLTVHGSGPNTSGQSRRGVTVQYVGESVRYNTAKLVQYEASLDAQVKGRA